MFFWPQLKFSPLSWGQKKGSPSEDSEGLFNPYQLKKIRRPRDGRPIIYDPVLPTCGSGETNVLSNLSARY